MPKEGKEIDTPMGKAKVLESNPLKETVLVELENQVSVEFPLNDILPKENKSEPEVPIEPENIEVSAEKNSSSGGSRRKRRQKK